MPDHLAPVEERRVAEADLALGDRLERARVDLAVGHVVAAVRGLPAPAFDADLEVGAGPDDAELANLGQRVGAGAQLRADAFPVRDRVARLFDVAGAEDEALVLVERHLRVLRVRLGREEDAEPAELAGGHPLPAPLGELLRGGDQALVALRVGVSQRAGVRLRPDRHERVDELELGLRDRRDVLQLLVVGLGEQQLRQALELEVDVRVRPCREGGAVDLDRERRRHRRRVDAQHLARLEAERVVDDELAQAGDAWIAHFFLVPTRKGRLTRTLARLEFMVALIRIA